MRFATFHSSMVVLGLAIACCYGEPSAAGIEALVKRRMPGLHGKFSFSLNDTARLDNATAGSDKDHDRYTVSNGPKGTVHISGNTEIALATGLRWYLVHVMKRDLYWFIGSRLDKMSSCLPRLKAPQSGSSIVPWRYHFNTVTFSYTTAFWDWSDWELQLDWMALHGINLPLAWLGYEKILFDTLQDAGFTEAQVIEFLSGPAFQAWNRFGNIQASWGGLLPKSWIDSQFELGKKIVARMVELGMTPALPAFTGYVPLAIKNIYPNASFARGNSWASFADKYTKDTFLEPSDPLYSTLQKNFMSKQKEAFGNVTHIYTLDQFNEIEPLSGDLDYLSNISNATMQSLKSADPDAVWMMQGWLFYAQSSFWTLDRINAYLGGVDDSSMIILDLFSESNPQWQHTKSYAGKPWIWCMLHGFGEVMGLYGQVENATVNPAEAAKLSASMVGMGATMEGQEGNEIVYDILFDQAWSKTPIDSKEYFEDWVAARYSSKAVRQLPQSLYDAWDKLRRTVYNNTDLTAASAVPAAIYTKRPRLSGLAGVKGPFGTTITYDPMVLQRVWTQFFQAGAEKSTLWLDSAFTFDFTDVTRQVLSNSFDRIYREFVGAVQKHDNATAKQTGHQLLSTLTDLDSILGANGNAHYRLDDWIESARAHGHGQNGSVADYYEYNARNQVTLWGPNGEINDYAGKEWSGLIKTYYLPRWRIFVDGHLSGSTEDDIRKQLSDFEVAWQEPGYSSSNQSQATSKSNHFQAAMAKAAKNWPSLFKM